MIINSTWSKPLLVSFFFNLLSTSLLAQSFFTSGYIVTQQGDTLSGEIQQEGNGRILFRNGKETSQLYTATQLKAYVIEGVPSIPVSWKVQDSVHHAFVKELLQGTVSLYGLSKPEGELTFFLQLPDKTFLPLEGKSSWNVLNATLTNCPNPSFMTRLDASQFRYVYTYFSTIVRAYNACIAPEKTVTQKRKPFHFQVGMLAAVTLNQWKYDAVEDRFNPYFQPNGLYPLYVSYTLGGYVMVMPEKRFSLLIEGYYGSYEGERVVDINPQFAPTVKRQRLYSFWKSYLAFPLSVRYVFADGLVRWYVKGGVSFIKELTNGGHMKSLDPNIVLDSDLFIRKGTSIGYLLGAGAEFKLGTKQRLNAEVRFVPHIIRDGGVTRLGGLRSYQFVLSAPFFQR